MSDDSSEESEDPLYGEDSSLTEGVSSDEYSSGELRRRFVCSGSSSSTGLDSTSSSEPYDEDDSDPEVIKFSGKSKNKDLVGFKTTPRDIETFLKADPVLNGSNVLNSRNAEPKNAPGYAVEWSASDSSEEDLAIRRSSGLPYKSRSQVETTSGPQKPIDDITIAFSVQETMKKISEQAEMDEEEVGAGYKKTDRKPSATDKIGTVLPDNKGTRSGMKSRSAQKDTNLLGIKGKTGQRVADNRKPIPTEARISARSDKNSVKTSQGRSSKKTLIKR
uniref:Uncharacterized protein n=1 Tax=Lygus hesperus TaxID=30085 RepID=A0A0K8SJ56_LYGHE